MAVSYRYALLRVEAGPLRGERLNVGLLIFVDEHLDVRLPRSLTKLNALSLAFDQGTIRTAAARLDSLDRAISSPDASPEARLAMLRDFSPFDFSSLGTFDAHSGEMYEGQIAQLMAALIDPEHAPAKKAQTKKTKLLTSLRSAFREERILASRGESLNAHRIVPAVELATGLVADFVLRNGAMHIIETVDATDEIVSPVKIIKNIALSALTIEQARMTYGDEATVGRLIYKATSETEAIASAALQAAEHQRIELVNWSSASDRLKLITTMTTLASPLPKKGRPGHPVNASVQRFFDIN